MRTDRETVIKAYKEAKEMYLKNRTDENWKKYCDAKRNCMLLGVRI